MAIAELLHRERARVESFEKQEDTSVLILSIGVSAVSFMAACASAR